ncbi:MAG: hypothetical protein WCF81_13195 [Roseiarcus sp.]
MSLQVSISEHSTVHRLPPPSLPARDSSFREQSPVHSARVRAEVEVHYRWHALYGRRLRLHYSEVRDGTRLSFVEAGPGVVIVMPSWMLDPAACAATTFGAPQVD